MRRILLTTTALVALGGISAASADVSISGNIEQRYDQWSDDDAAGSGLNNSAMSRDMQLWVKSSATLDNGMTVGANIRMREATAGGDRNYVSLGGDFGSFVFGTTWAPVYSMSVGQNWMEDVASGEYTGGSDIDTTSTVTADDGATRGRLIEDTYQQTSAKGQKLVYTTPSINGLKLAISFADAGKTSKGDHTSLGATYDVEALGGAIKLMYGTETADHANATSTTADQTVYQYGAQYSADFGRVWALAMGSETETNAGSKTSDITGNQFGIAYNMSDAATLVYYHTSSEESAAASSNTDDEFSSNAVGVNYNVGGGFSVGLLHTLFDYTDATNSSATSGQGSNDGSATRVQLRVDF